MALTDDQNQKLEDRRLSDGSRPVVYSASSEAELEIGESFEEFLILAVPEVREEIKDRLSEAAEVDADHEAIFKRAIQYDAEDANTMRKSYNEKLGDFTAFRTTLLEQPGATAPEVAGLQTDIRRAQGRLVAEMDELQHRAQIAGFLGDIYDANVNNFDKKKQRESWPVAIEAYE